MQKQEGSLSVTTHPPGSSVTRQRLQKILEAAQWGQSCPEDMFQNWIFVILCKKI